MSKPNPYEVTGTVSRLAEARVWPLQMGLIAITILFTIAVLVSLLEPFYPGVRAFTLPRFGGNLMMCANPIIFLVGAIRSPTRTNLILAGLVTVSIGVISATSLWHTGTFAIIQSGYTQRLHSSWLWSVLPYFLAGGYIFLCAAYSPSKPDGIRPTGPLP